MPGRIASFLAGRHQAKAASNLGKLDTHIGKLEAMGTDASRQLLETVKDTHGALETAKAAHLDALAGKTGTNFNVATTALKEANEAAKDAAKASKTLIKGVNKGKWAFKLGKFGIGKIALITGAVVGGLAWWSNSSRKKAEQQSLESMATNYAGTGANTYFGIEPTPGVMAARVRGQGAEVAMNPNLASVDGRPVQDLGAIRT